MMQPSVIFGPHSPAAATPGGAGTRGSGAGGYGGSASTTAATAAAVSFIPERAPSFARQRVPRQANNLPAPSPPSYHNHNNNHSIHSQHQQHRITYSHSHSHSHSRSSGSDFIHVDRSNNRRMAAPPDRVDSWIEVASQPSDSYTSSSSPEDPILASGLQVQRRKNRARRRRNSTSTAIPAASRAVESSDEYDDDDDDDEDLDGLDLNAIESMGSSITDPSLSEGEEGSSDEEDDEDEGEIQPVAGLSSYVSAPLRPQNNFRTFSRDPPQPDHDAALRASLSTLLSCAAGVGSASKPRPNERLGSIQEHARPAPIQTLSLVTDSEREAMMSAPRRPPPPPQYRRTVHNPPPPQSPLERKRPVSPRRPREEVQATSKHKPKTKTRRSSKTTAAPNATMASTMASISASNMTYLTLAVSAGAVIIVSAISFSAGYALGKEVGRSEMLELGSSGGDIVKRAASGTVGKVGGRIVMSSGMGSGLRSITVS
ncbi:hypothetical protein TWF730_007839 [Orbilia blumenaviensis]|uniref:Uncharacterized protein n=1 Tax=Orbilia blumenaviensis TaxID=1796055 RepID=A0AAV9V9Q5_9PEZI